MKLPNLAIKRPSLLMLTAVAAGLSTVAHGVSAEPAEEQAAKPAKAQQTRLGNAIQTEIKQRSEKATERARQLDLKEQVIKASEKRLEDKLKAGQADAAAVDAAQGDPAAEEADTINQLARIYQSMKPKQAARVFEQLDMDVQIAVALQMRERATAQILAAMTPASAAKLSMALAGKPAAPAPKIAKK